MPDGWGATASTPDLLEPDVPLMMSQALSVVSIYFDMYEMESQCLSRLLLNSRNANIGSCEELKE